MKRATRFLVVFLFSLIAVRTYAADSQSLQSLADEALRNNPAIAKAHEQWQAAEYRIRSVRSLPDPMASYTYFGENVETRVGPQEHKYGVSQKIPFPGKLSLKEKAQIKRAQMLKENYEAVKRETIKDVKFIYYDIFWVNKAIQINDDEKAIMENVESVAQKRYESGLKPQQDVVKAQVELSKLIDKLFTLKQHKNTLVAKLNSILNRPQPSALEVTSELKPSGFKYSIDELRSKANESRQELLAADLDVQRAEYEKSLANFEYLPDVTLGFDYIQVGKGHTMSPNDGEDAWMAMAAINVPIWFDKLSAQVNEKNHELEASKKNYQDLENRLSYEIEDVYFKVNTYNDIISLYDTALIPQARQSFDVAKTAYEAGKMDFLNWLDTERILLQTRLAYYKAIADYEKSIAYLERVVGADL